MVFVCQQVNCASQDTTQQGMNSAFLWATAILNFISTVLLVHAAVKWLSATHEEINMLTGQGVNERTLAFSAEPDKVQVGKDGQVEMFSVPV